MTHTHSTQRIRVWDLPTRVFHAILIFSIAGLFITGELGDEVLRFHFWLGYTVLTLVFFRIAWGLVGGHWSRFINFIPTPTRLFTYIRSIREKRSPQHVGHNPLGALSVLAMLIVLLLQVFSGFMSDDEIANTGPWVALVPSDWVELATEYHTEIGKVLLIALIGLHFATVLYYKLFKNTDLISPMLHGDKVLPIHTHHSRDTYTSRLFAISILLTCAYAVYRLVNIS
jgi:cytochrome b